MQRSRVSHLLNILVFVVCFNHFRLAFLCHFARFVVEELRNKHLIVGINKVYIVFLNACRDKALNVHGLLSGAHFKAIVPKKVAVGIELGQHGVGVGIAVKLGYHYRSGPIGYVSGIEGLT